MPDLSDLIQEFLEKAIEKSVEESRTLERLVSSAVEDQLGDSDFEIDSDKVRGLSTEIDDRISSWADDELTGKVVEILQDDEVKGLVQDLVDEALRKSFAKLGTPVVPPQLNRLVPPNQSVPYTEEAVQAFNSGEPEERPPMPPVPLAPITPEEVSPAVEEVRRNLQRTISTMDPTF